MLVYAFVVAVAMVRVVLPGGKTIVQKFVGNDKRTVGALLLRIFGVVSTFLLVTY
jgi:hypothetical protein